MPDVGVAGKKLTLQDLIRTIPRQCFQPNPWKATAIVAFSVLMVGFGYALLIWDPTPWLLPLSWIFTGTALTGWFVIGHDCGHRSFAKSRWVNDWVGTIMFLPLFYPFHAWRLGHDHHHRFTNHIDEDNAWRPLTQPEFGSAPSWVQTIYRSLRGYLWWIASIAHWASVHFRSSELLHSQKPRDRQQWVFSSALVVVAAAIVFPTLIYTAGIWGFVKFWLMPWLVYHFWMSTFTLVHHTHPDVPFFESTAWDPAQAQLECTVHCDYPVWVEWLCHDINVHIPHHISTAIPSYNLRQADAALQQHFGDKMLRTRFDGRLMRAVVERCHLHDLERPYLSFREWGQRSV